MRNRIVLCIILTLFCLFSSFSEDTRDYEFVYSKDFAIKADLGVEYNYWLPDESYYLKYDTTGLSLLKGDIKFTNSIKYIPEVHLKFQTSLAGSDSDDILQEQEKNDGLKAVYNKIECVAGWGKRIADYTSCFDYYNPWRPNSNVELFFSRETFRISVTPTVSDLWFIDYNGNINDFSTDKTLTMYTKFDELQLNFATNGYLIMPALLNILFGSDSTTSSIVNSGFDTQLGAFYSTWQKPYSISQVLTTGSISGYDNVIYAAKFNALGVVEKFYYADKYFYFANQCNLGIAWVNLADNSMLTDSSAPIFMQFKIKPTIGFHLPLFSDRFVFSSYCDLDWGIMVGVAADETGSSALTITSIINSDLLIKPSCSITYIY